MKLSDLPQKPPKILLYGPPGSGKTALAMTLGEGTYYLDLDDGLETGRHLKDKFYDARNAVEVRQFLEQETLKARAFHLLRNHLVEVEAQIKKGTFPHSAIVLDSLSALAYDSMRYIMGNKQQIGQKISQPDWGLIITEIQMVVTTLRLLPIPVILIAHQMLIEIDEKNFVKLGVFGKNLPGWVTGSFDEVWYMKPFGGQYIIQTKPTNAIETRSRLCLENGLPSSLGLPEILSRVGYKWNPKSVKQTADQPA